MVFKPADGAENVDSRTEFSVMVPSWADAVQIEICTDPECQQQRVVFDEPIITSVEVTFHIGDNLQPGTRFYWRVRGRSGGNVKGPAITRSFSTATTKPETSANLNPPPADATAGTSPPSHLDHEAANAAIIAAVDANDFAKADEISAEFRRGSADDASAVSWGDAYRWAKTGPQECKQAQRFLADAKRSTAPDPGNVSGRVRGACVTPMSLYVDTFYDVAVTGSLTPEGIGLALGLRGQVWPNGKGDPRASIGAGALTVRSDTDGGRIRFWAGEVRGDVGMAEPAPASIRFDWRAQIGGGSFAGPDNRHGASFCDAVPGVSVKLRLSTWLRVALRAGVHFGFAIDGGKQVDTGLTGFGERWHGTIGFDAGLMLDTFFDN